MKIDTSTIAGYADMTAEEKLKALEELELAEPDYSGYVSKATFDKTASELAAKKKELNDHLTAEEKAAKEREESNKELKESYEKLLRETNISKATAKFLALGYDDKLASETAIAYVDGDTEKVFANQKKAMDTVEKNIRAELLKGSPKPDGGGSDPSGESIGEKFAKEFNSMYVTTPQGEE